jgi:hypothetical protein
MRADGGNVQAVLAPGGSRCGSPNAEPGSVHDITAARTHAVPALYAAAAAGLAALADAGYGGAKVVSPASAATTRAPPPLGPVADHGRARKTPRCIGFSRCRWLPVWRPGGGPPLLRISGLQFCLVSAYPPVHPRGDVSIE